MSVQNRQICPFPTRIFNQVKTSLLILINLFASHEFLGLTSAIQKLLRSPPKTSFLYQATQTEPDWKKSNQISLKQHALFQVNRSLIPSPPSSFVLVTTSQETLAEWPPSMFPSQKNLPHSELIRLMHSLGSRNVEHQKLLIPAMTVFISKSLSANDRLRTLHELNFPFI